MTERRSDTYDTVENVEGRLEINSRTEPVHLDHHLKHEEAQENEFGDFWKRNKDNDREGDCKYNISIFPEVKRTVGKCVLEAFSWRACNLLYWISG